LDGEAVAGYAPIVAVERGGPLPLSFAQQRLWFIDRLEGDSRQYNMPTALKLSGALDLAALQGALDGVVARHEVLRTTYVEVEGTAVQVVQAAAAVPIERIDLGALAGPEQALRLAQLARAEAAQPFDLARDLMLRCVLIRLGAAEHALLFTLHHIAADGWSIGVLVQEFVALYSGGVQGQAGRVPVLPIQYADYAVWQRQRLQGEELARQLDYWRDQLAGLPAVHNLPLDRPRPAQQRFEGARLELGVDAAVLAGLKALALGHEASLFMLLQAALAVLLSRWSSETDIVLGTPIAGRTHKDVEPLIGLFVNTLVLRTDLAGNPGFAAVLAQSKARALAAYGHQEVPFEMLVDELKPVRSLSHAPLFQVLFSMKNNEQAVLELPGLRLAPLQEGYEHAKFDLQLSAAETAQGLRLSWLYATSLFEAASMARLGAAFGRLLQGIVAAPDTPIEQLPLLGADDQALLARWNDTKADFRQACFHHLFEQQAARTPDRIAVRFGERTLSYRELDLRANQLAQHLRNRGVGPDTPVALCLERSLDLPLAILGAMKAGGAYVPLDPASPDEHLRYILQDSGASLLLIHGTSAQR
ncbi:MAG TPA: condensation domain-containing protein, partial [Chloroflexota bacterium]|nr:condensation domain-containing protein [Chloroflexota bacterium]